jgi:hypothetical protein
MFFYAQVGATQSAPTGITGIFSTFRVSERTGDILGMELMVLGGSNGVAVVVQGSEGAPGTPVVLGAAIRANTIEFEVPASCPCAMLQGKYRGQIDADGIDLEGPGSGGPRHLPRSDSFWQSW